MHHGEPSSVGWLLASVHYSAACPGTMSSQIGARLAYLSRNSGCTSRLHL